MIRAAAIALAALAFPAGAGASLISTTLRAFSPLEDRPGALFRSGDGVDIVAHGYAPDSICGKAAFTLTDSAGKKFHLGDVHPGFGQWGEGFINRQVGVIPAAAAFGQGVIDSNQTCKNIGHIRGKTGIRIGNPSDPLPAVSAAVATDASSGGISTLRFSLDRYAEVYVDVQYEFVPGDWRTIDTAADNAYYDDAGPEQIQWTANVGGPVPPGHYRYLISPRAPTVGIGKTVTRDFYVARPVVRGLTAPAGIAINPLGNLVVTEPTLHRLRTFTLAGAPVMPIDQSSLVSPVDAAFLPGGALTSLIAEASTHRVLRHVLSGNTITSSLFAGPANFSPTSGPTGIAVVGSSVDVVDGDRPQVLAFDPAGTLVRTITRPGALVHPTDVAGASDGSLWVADAGSGRILHFSAERTYLGQVVIPGSAARTPPLGRPTPSQPVQVAVEPDGRPVLTERTTNRAVVVGASLVSVGTDLLQQPTGVATVGRSGDFLVADAKLGEVLQFRVP